MDTESITWTPVAAALPDADITVLCFDEESMAVVEGFYDGIDEHDGRQVWRDVTAMELGIVTHWAEMPHGPQSVLENAD